MQLTWLEVELWATFTRRRIREATSTLVELLEARMPLEMPFSENRLLPPSTQ